MLEHNQNQLVSKQSLLSDIKEGTFHPDFFSFLTVNSGYVYFILLITFRNNGTFSLG